jgi:hypothetical protein
MSRRGSAHHRAEGAEGSAAPVPRELPPEVQETVKIMTEVMVESRRRELAAQAEAGRRPRRRSLLSGVSPETRARVLRTVPGWPTLAEAAAMLGIAETALPPEVETWGRGPRPGRRVPPGEVIDLAPRRSRREVEYVAADLVQYAVEHAPEAAAEVHDQVDRAMAATAPRPHVSADSFLAVARWYLPPELCRSVVAAVRSRVREEQCLRKRPAGASESQGEV